MTYPMNLLTRSVSVGGAGVLEAPGVGLLIRARVRASRPLTVAGASTFRLLNVGVEGLVAPAGAPLVFPLLRTDQDGFVDPSDGTPIVIGEGMSRSHEYLVDVDFLTKDRSPVPGVRYTYGPFALPAGDGPLDLDTEVPTAAAGFPPVAQFWNLSGLDDFPPEAKIGDWGIDFSGGLIRFYTNKEA